MDDDELPELIKDDDDLFAEENDYTGGVWDYDDDTFEEDIGDNKQFILFGDMGYTRRDVIQGPFKKLHLTAAEKAFNDVFKKLRVTVEWSFGWVVKLFPYVDFAKTQIIGQRPV